MEQAQDSPDVEELLALSTSGPQLLAELDDCVRRLRQVQDARFALAQLPADQVRQAIARRHRRITNLRCLP